MTFGGPACCRTFLGDMPLLRDWAQRLVTAADLRPGGRGKPARGRSGQGHDHRRRELGGEAVALKPRPSGGVRAGILRSPYVLH